MDYSIFVFIFGLLFDFKHVFSLTVTDINVPAIVDFRDNVTLSCGYDMGGHTLNSVKWYKDEMEFFRYSPMMHPFYMKFPVNGAEVHDNNHFCNESVCRIVLSPLGKRSSGVYRCEVSGDAPHFKLTTKAANMTVAALPQHSPLISGFNQMYHYDEFVTANCTSDFSSLPAIVKWYINGEEAQPVELYPPYNNTFVAHDYYLRRQTVQVHFYVNGPHFVHSRKNLELRCVADIMDYPHLRRESRISAILTHDQNLNNQMLLSAGGQYRPTPSLLFIILLGLRLGLFINQFQADIFS